MDIPLIGHISRPDKRHFAPDQDPAAVALVVKARMVRITGSPDGIGAHLGNQIQILFDLVLFQRDPHRRPVFVMHHAVNPIRTAVQQESLLRIDAEKAQSERHRNLVAHASLVGQLHAHGIHIRILDAIPQRRISDDHRYGRRSPAVPRDFDFRTLHDHRIAVRRFDGQIDRKGLTGRAAHPHDRLQIGLFAGDLFLVDINALRRVIVHGDMRRIGYDQFDIAVQSPVNVDVPGGRKHVEPRGVIDDHPQRVVLAVFQVIGQIERECAVTAPVFADIAPVDDQVGHGSGPAKADENPPTGPLFRYGDIFHVITYPPEIVVSAAQGVVVPHVRQVHALRPVAGTFGMAEETPIPVYINHVSCRQLRQHKHPCDQNPDSFHMRCI